MSEFRRKIAMVRGSWGEGKRVLPDAAGFKENQNQKLKRCWQIFFQNNYHGGKRALGVELALVQIDMDVGGVTAKGIG